MKNQTLGYGLLLATLAAPLCAVILSPTAPQSAFRVLSLWQPAPRKLEPLEVRQKRPWLNPARATLTT